MKKILLICAIALFCFTGISQAASNFIEIARDDNYLVYLDADSLEDKGNYVLAWTKWIPRGEALKNEQETCRSKIDHSMILVAQNKKARQYQVLYRIFYYRSNVVSSEKIKFNSSNYSQIIPGSYAEFIWEATMKIYRNK